MIDTLLKHLLIDIYIYIYIIDRNPLRVEASFSVIIKVNPYHVIEEDRTKQDGCISI